MPSGKFALVAGMSTNQGWTLGDTQTSDAFIVSNTGGATGRGGGVRAWSGSFNGRGGNPPVMPNEIFTFDGYTYPDTGVEGTNGIIYSGKAICSSIVMNWDWSTNALISWVCNFQGRHDPGLTVADGSPTLDATFPTGNIPCNLDVTYDDEQGGGPLVIPKLVSLTLTITAALAAQTNSSTGDGTDCWTSYEPGTLDWALSAVQQDYQRGVDGYPQLSQDAIYEIPVSANPDDSWRLRWGRPQGYTNLALDRASNTMISRTLEVAMQAVSTTELGYLKRPGETTSPYWGVDPGP